MALAPVQSKFQNNGSTNPSTITFGSPLTTGNKCYIFAYGSLLVGSLNTVDWTVESTNGPGGGSGTQYLLSRTVQVGDGATPPAFATGTNITFRVIGVEVGGGTPTVDAIVQSTNTSAPIAGPTTAFSNELGLLASGAGAGFGSYTPGSGWSNLQADTGGSTTLDDRFFATAGSSLTTSPSWSVNGTAGHWMSVALKSAISASVNLTGVSVTGTAHALTVNNDIAKNLVHAAAIATAHTAAPNHDASVTPTQAAAIGVARQVPNLAGAFLRHAEAVGHAGSLEYVNVHLVGARAYPAALPIGMEIAPPIPYFPIFSIMRDTPVAASGAMSDAPVVGEGALFPSRLLPGSAAIRLVGAVAGGHAATISPFFNVNLGLRPALGIPVAGTVFGIGNVI